LIPELLRGIAIVERILSCPYGSLLLAGRAGAGRKSSIRLAATLHGARLFTLSMASGYSIKHFKKDLKAVRKFLLVNKHNCYKSNFYAGHAGSWS
jgi:dynein heavy chain 2